jgi:drug/metabolite transporter (DMT)-like permease
MNPILAMVLAAVLWSTGGLFIKVISVDALSLAAMRSAVAAVALFAIARALGVRVRIPRSPLSWAAAIVYAAILLLFVASTKLTTAANAIFLQYTAPIYVVLLEPVLLKTRFRARELAFVGVSLVGMALFFAGKIEAGNGLGNLLALASGVCFAVFALLSRMRHDDAEARWQAVTCGNAILPVAIFTWFALTPAEASWPSGAGEVAGILFLGVVQIGVAYALFVYAIARLSALESTLVGMIEPMLNPVWVFFGTGERPSTWAFLGAALIVGSLVVRAVVTQNDRRDDASFDVPAPS